MSHLDAMWHFWRNELKSSIFLKDFIVETEIGIHDFEHGKKQPLKINVRLDVETNHELFVRDEIELTVDYDFIRQEILFILNRSERLNTQEYLVHQLAKAFADRQKILGGYISSEKLSVYPESCSVGYSLEF